MNALTRRSVLLGATFLTACLSIRDPVPGVFGFGDVFSVTLTRTWSDFSPEAPNVRLLSLNGPTIDRLYLAALRSGDGLAPRVPARDALANFSMETATTFVVESLTKLGYRAPAITTAEARPFGGAGGVRVTIATKTGDGLLIDGEARLCVHNKRLCVMLHLAAREHYFAATSPDAQAVMDSVQLL